jgi:uncharacterized protein YuzE
VKVTLGRYTFDNVFYDADVDVLYLHMGDSSTAVDFDESPEGHALRFDANGNLVGVTILNAKRLIERDGGRAAERAARKRPLYRRRAQNARASRQRAGATRPRWST